MGLLKRNPFGHILFIKKWLIRILGCLTHRRYRGFNELQIEGSEIIKNLPESNVLFISNHQTYFADVVAMFHVFNASLSGRTDSIKNVGYLWQPKMNVYYVAAKETMKSGLLPKLFSLAGAILVDRSWRAEGVNIKREIDSSAGDNVAKALKSGWVISFPQGTTSPYAPIRKGTAHIILTNRPIVVPVVINGFRRAFNKTGLKYKRRNTLLSVKFKKSFL
jgi:1-acyl-sn-glycerol-3-phosphate acyltransferase